MQTLFSLRNIEKRFGDRVALAIDRLDLLPGRLYCLTGPNGAGKSTLLSILSLLERPCGGQILVNERAVSAPGASPRDLQREITLVHQRPYMLRGSVERNLLYGLKLRGLSRREQNRRLLWALQTVGLAGFEGRCARELSGGEQQRVALARALALKPKVLLLDEPMAGLDAGSSEALERIIASLDGQGLTTVLSTHDATLPARLGAEEVRLNQGRIDGSGRPDSNTIYPNVTETSLCLSPLKMQEV